jgi:hypothetical protein
MLDLFSAFNVIQTLCVSILTAYCSITSRFIRLLIYVRCEGISSRKSSRISNFMVTWNFFIQLVDNPIRKTLHKSGKKRKGGKVVVVLSFGILVRMLLNEAIYILRVSI